MTEKAQWVPREGMVPSPSPLARLSAKRSAVATQSDKSPENLTPVSELPPGIQAQVQSQQRHWRDQIADKGGVDYAPLREDSVTLEVEPKLSVIVPGVGIIPFPGEVNFNPSDLSYMEKGDSAWASYNLIPPDLKAALPVRISGHRFERRVLATSARNETEYRDAALLA